MRKSNKGSDYVRVLTKDEVEKVVNGYPTKYGKRGFTECEKKSLLKQYAIDEKKFNKVLGVVSYRIIKGETVYCRRNIRRALCMSLVEGATLSSCK